MVFTKPLHNFILPCLKSGSQRHLRCTKLPSDYSSADAADQGIDAFREKLMLDLKTEADKIKDAILCKEVAEYNNVVEMNDAQPPPVTGVRRWNLHKRRATVAGDKGVRIDERRGGGGGSSLSPLRMKSPKLRVSPEKKERRPVKFSPTLAKKEIEADFMRIVSHRPPRRPNKRPRNVQKQLDTLFPGQWLSEVCADSYKVPDDAETGKR